MKPLLDEEIHLAQKAASGDRQAVKILFERFSDALYAFIYQQTDAPIEDVQDIWQESLSAAFRNISSYRGDSRFFTWLCGISRRKVIDHYRHEKTPVWSQSKSLEAYQDVIDTQQLPEDVLIQKEVCLKVIEALANLSPEYREVLVERYIHQQSVLEIAEHTKRSYKAAESLLSRARDCFRKLLN